MSNVVKRIIAVVAILLTLLLGSWIVIACIFARPKYHAIEGSGLPSSLVYAVIKTESDFQEDAVSRAGAVGLMQLLPSTAEYVCRLRKIPFERERLTEGEYNITLGCAYLTYLFSRFEVEETVLAAYNAGEGIVAEWLANDDFSSDGKTLFCIPYRETAEYVKKIKNFRKIYQFFGDKT